jgi:hypothetical protein
MICHEENVIVLHVSKRWNTRPDWSVTVVDIAEGSRTRSRTDVCSHDDGCAIFMLDVEAGNGQNAMSDHVRPDHTAYAPWSALAHLNSTLFCDEMTVASACLGICAAGGLIRVAFADFPSIYVKHRAGTIRRIPGGGAPLGLFAEMRFPEKICMLERGEAMMFVNNGADLLIDDGTVNIPDLFAGRVDDRDALPTLTFAATALTFQRTDFAFAEPLHARTEGRACV